MGEWCGMVKEEAINMSMTIMTSPEEVASLITTRLVAVVIVLATIRTYHHLVTLTRRTPRHSVSCYKLPSPATVCAVCSGPASAWQCQA